MKYAVLLLAAVVASACAQQDYKSEYLQYANVKGPKEYAHGYSRGNPHHHRTHHQRNKDHTFQAKVTWNDYSGGQGEHYIEYNHGPKPTGYPKPQPYAPQPYEPQPYEPQPYAPQPYAPQPYAPQPYESEPYKPEPYEPKPSPYKPLHS